MKTMVFKDLRSGMAVGSINKVPEEIILPRVGDIIEITVGNPENSTDVREYKVVEVRHRFTVFNDGTLSTCANVMYPY